MLDIETNSLRIELQTAAGSTGNGFELSLFCDETLQTLPNVKFKPQLSENWYFDENQDMYALRNCLNDSINIAIEPIYLNPELENQNVDSVLIKWALGNGSFKREKGLTSINHAYISGSGYLVTVYSQDSLGIESHLKFMVQNSPPPTYSVNTDQSFCLDDPTEIIGGMNGNQVVGAEAGVGSIFITEFFGTFLYIPDSDNNDYSTTIEVSGFPEGTTISSVSDLAELCVNMEHTWLGDLEMGLTCPDGTMIIIFNSYNNSGNLNQLFPGGFGGGSIFLGDALWGSQYNGIPGIGFDYCFSDDATTGSFAEVFDDPDYLFYSSLTPGRKAIFPGTYRPEESFSSLEGCPVNGEWVLTVRDNWSIDDGFIFDWSLGFNDELSTSGFQNALVSATWEANDWVTALNEGSVEVTPQNSELHEMTFLVTDVNGCDFSKNLTLQIADTLTPVAESGICNLVYDLEWSPSIGYTQFYFGSKSRCFHHKCG